MFTYLYKLEHFKYECACVCIYIYGHKGLDPLISEVGAYRVGTWRHCSCYSSGSDECLSGQGMTNMLKRDRRVLSMETQPSHLS